MKRGLLFACLLSSLAPALSVGAGAPPGRYVVRKGTVYDTRTKLTWQQSIDPDTHSQPDAVSLCATLQLDGTGWRLPSVRELVTIADRTRVSPAIDPTAFPKAPSNGFWTSSNGFWTSSGEFFDGGVNASLWWAVYFDDGNTDVIGDSEKLRVRCVR